MVILTNIIGILIVLEGVALLVRPAAMQKVIAFFMWGGRIYIAGVLRLAIGVIFLLAASQCVRSGIMIAIGILFLIGGVMIFAIRLEKLKSILQWWLEKPLYIYRFLCLSAFGIGALILYAA